MDLESRYNLANDPSRWVGLRNLQQSVISGSITNETDRETWVLLHIMPYLFWNWRPLPSVLNSPHMDDEHDDVALEDIMWDLRNEAVRIRIRAVIEDSDWSTSRTSMTFLPTDSPTPTVLQTSPATELREPPPFAEVSLANRS